MDRFSLSFFKALKHISRIFIVIAALGIGNHATAFGETFYDLKATTIDGKPFAFSALKGKVVLIVNVASRCGFTGQYKDLQNLHSRYSEMGLVILGFPSNQFNSQEPGSNEEIKKFCQDNYQVKFTIFEKADVNGKSRQPVYQYLLANAPKEYAGDIGWNFTKILINRKGKFVDRFSPLTNPSRSSVTSKIEELLAEKP